MFTRILRQRNRELRPGPLQLHHLRHLTSSIGLTAATAVVQLVHGRERISQHQTPKIRPKCLRSGRILPPVRYLKIDRRELRQRSGELESTKKASQRNDKSYTTLGQAP